jgi:hypothetical protein
VPVWLTTAQAGHHHLIEMDFLAAEFQKGSGETLKMMRLRVKLFREGFRDLKKISELLKDLAKP